MNLSTRPGHVPDPLSTVCHCFGADASCGARARRPARPPKTIPIVDNSKYDVHPWIPAAFQRVAGEDVRSLEEEHPPTITTDRITTHYVHHLETTLTAEDFKELERQIRRQRSPKSTSHSRAGSTARSGNSGATVKTQGSGSHCTATNSHP